MFISRRDKAYFHEQVEKLRDFKHSFRHFGNGESGMYKWIDRARFWFSNAPFEGETPMDTLVYKVDSYKMDLKRLENQVKYLTPMFNEHAKHQTRVEELENELEAMKELLGITKETKSGTFLQHNDKEIRVK